MKYSHRLSALAVLAVVLLLSSAAIQPVSASLGLRGVINGWEMESAPQSAPFTPGDEFWAAGFGEPPAENGTNGFVHSLATHGNAVYVGGKFTHAGNCLPATCYGIAKWDGANWRPLSTGVNTGPTLGSVEALAVTSDGRTLYAGGYFTGAGNCTSDMGCTFIAKWDGANWTPLETGMDGIVFALALSPDGTTLYAGGYFTSAGSCTVGCRGIAKWDGTIWSSVGGGTNDLVDAIAIAPDGTLYAGGAFSAASGCGFACSHLARWDGTAWHPMDTRAYGSGPIEALTLSADGDTLYVGGAFSRLSTCTDCNFIARWDVATATWNALDTGMNRNVRSLSLSADGSTLYAGGQFERAGSCTSVMGCNNIAQWKVNGGGWSSLGGGITSDEHGVFALAPVNGLLWLGGEFTDAGDKASANIARWEGPLAGPPLPTSTPTNTPTATLSPTATATGSPPTMALYLPLVVR